MPEEPGVGFETGFDEAGHGNGLLAVNTGAGTETGNCLICVGRVKD